MKTPKEIWLERISWLKPMLENAESAIDTIDKAEGLNSESLAAVVGLNEVYHTDSLVHLRACNNNSIVSNARLLEMPHHNFPKD